MKNELFALQESFLNIIMNNPYTYQPKISLENDSSCQQGGLLFVERQALPMMKQGLYLTVIIYGPQN